MFLHVQGANDSITSTGDGEGEDGFLDANSQFEDSSNIQPTELLNTVQETMETVGTSKEKVFKSPKKMTAVGTKRKPDPLAGACKFLEAKAANEGKAVVSTMKNVDEDDFDIFGKLIARKLRAMDYCTSESCMNDIHNLIFKANMKRRKSMSGATSYSDFESPLSPFSHSSSPIYFPSPYSSSSPTSPYLPQSTAPTFPPSPQYSSLSVASNVQSHLITPDNSSKNDNFASNYLLLNATGVNGAGLRPPNNA